MSQANVEIVRRGFAALAEQGVEGVIPFFTEDVVIYSIPEWLDDPEYHGHTTASGGSSGSGRRTSTSSPSNFGTCMTEETGVVGSSSSAARQNVPFFR